MKPIKLTFLSALALGAIVVTVPVSRAQDTKDTPKPATPSQGERRGGPPGAASFDRVAERLKLSDEQKTKLQPVWNEEMGKLRDLRQDQSLTQEQRRDKVKEIREQYLAKMKPVLTTEQYDQLKAMRQQAAGRGPRGVRQPGTAPANPPPSGDDKK
jgi:hypothetical protein